MSSLILALDLITRTLRKFYKNGELTTSPRRVALKTLRRLSLMTASLIMALGHHLLIIEYYTPPDAAYYPQMADLLQVSISRHWGGREEMQI